MKEEELKKIISKSTVETSDDFINNLMNVIEVKEQTKNTIVSWSLKIVLLVCFILIMLVLWVLPKVIDYDLFNVFSFEVPKTPLFIMITFVFLYYVNSMVRLNYHNSK